MSVCQGYRFREFMFLSSAPVKIHAFFALQPVFFRHRVQISHVSHGLTVYLLDFGPTV
jgi:hypothetical protein